MKDVYGPSVNKWMCTPACPCDDKHKATWEKYENQDLKDDGRNRVKSFADLTITEKTILNSADEEGAAPWNMQTATVLPLYWGTVAGTGEASNLNKATGVFDNFFACYEANLKPLWGSK